VAARAGAAGAIAIAADAGQPAVDGHRLTELDSGVRVVTEAMPSVRSAALGFWIGTGSCAETDEQAGLSHLLEHLLFRGSERFGSLEIDQIFDGMGAELNAGTGKETTSVYSRVLDRHLPRALEVISDMVWRPAFEDADTEREVVLEEIAMYEDDPQDKVFDVLGEAIFGDHPLGRAIIGRAEVIERTPLDAIAAFHAARYVPGDVVVAAAGSVDHDELVSLVEGYLPDRDGKFDLPGSPPDGAEPRVRFESKETEQYHVALGAPGIARHDERRFALRVLDNVLGGTSSSRLFQEVRERRGLAYSVYSFSSQYANAGQVGIYLGTRGDNLGAALDVVGSELERLRVEPVTAEELQRSKENVKGRLVLSLESTTARMNRLGASVLTGVPLLSVDELVARIDRVTLEDVALLALELFDPSRLSAAGIGPDEEPFRAALEPVSTTLAAAA
jgi:predicted Zn-dependent peptidase